MSCVIGLCQSRRVLLAGDSLVTVGQAQSLAVSPTKVWSAKHCLMGAVGQGFALRIRPSLSPPETGLSAMQQAVRWYEEYRADWERANGPEIDSEVIFAWPAGGVWVFCTEGSAHQALAPPQRRRRGRVFVNAIGSGADVALGALGATIDAELTLAQRATEALTWAAYYTVSVAPPFCIEEMRVCRT